MSVTNVAAPMTDAQLDQLSVNTIRTLSIDAVELAKSGHPGTPTVSAPLVLHDLEPCDALRSRGSDLAQS